MATREEKYSTRGRARILFDALTTDLLPEGLTDPALKDTLDLCLSCKACKAECPSSVDMAAYRAEFFSHYYRDHPRPLGSSFFGRLHELARVAMIAPSLANAVSHVAISRSITKRVLRIHPKRDLPRFATQSFRAWFERRPASTANQSQVVLFPDTFNNFFEPRVAIAAVEVLEHAGFRVIIPRRDICCGRPLYDQGMLEQAKRRLLDAIELLGPFAAARIFIVGLEPSCILTFRDELPSMFPGDARAQELADHSLMLDEFLTRHAPDFAPGEIRAPAILQRHCHQGALADAASEPAILARVAGLELEVPDTGCCGMAGAFGYDREHYEVSAAIAMRRLVPAIEKARPGTIVIADGFSCRAQIRHFCPTRSPLHLAEVLHLANNQRLR